MADENKVASEIAMSEAEQTLDAIKDLEAIEEEIAEEAGAAVADYDAMGDAEAAAEAAETVQEFKEAELGTEEVLDEIANDEE